jgi:hypothetical protein
MFLVAPNNNQPIQHLVKKLKSICKRMILVLAICLTSLSFFAPATHAATSTFGKKDIVEINEISKQVASKDKKTKEKGIKRIENIINKAGKEKVKKLFKEVGSKKDIYSAMLVIQKYSRDEIKGTILSFIPTNFEKKVTTTKPKTITKSTTTTKETQLFAQNNGQCEETFADFTGKSKSGDIYNYGAKIKTCWDGNKVYGGEILYTYYSTYSWYWEFVAHRYQYCKYLENDKYFDCLFGGEFRGGFPSPWGQVTASRAYPVAEGLRGANGYYITGGWVE